MRTQIFMNFYGSSIIELFLIYFIMRNLIKKNIYGLVYIYKVLNSLVPPSCRALRCKTDKSYKLHLHKKSAICKEFIGIL